MAQPLRIAFIDYATSMGGGQRLLLMLIDGLPREKFEPTLIVSRAGVWVDEARRHNVSVKLCALPRFLGTSWQVGARKVINPFAVFWNIINLLYSSWKLSNVLRQSKIDLAQTNSVFAHIYGGLAARLSGLPCLWYFHDLIETRRLGGSLALVWRFLAKHLATHVVAVSQAVLRALSIESPSSVIYAGSQSAEISATPPISLRDRIKLAEGSHLVIFIGRISHSKGLDVLARAARIVVDRDPDVHFVIFGEADSEDYPYEQYLINLIKQLEITQRWHWMGYDSQARDWIVDSELLVLPSRREALGLALIEAALAKKATVATRVGGIPEAVIDGETGILVPVEDAEALALAILRLIDDPALATRMGLNADSHVRQRFSMSRYYEEFIALYDSLN